MPTRCLLIPTAAGVDATRRYDAATRLGLSLHAHLKVLFVSPEPARLLAQLPEVAIAAGVTLDSLKSESATAARVGKAALRAWCDGKGIPLSDTHERIDATFATWQEIVGDLETEVALAGRVNDLIVIDEPDMSEPFTERVFDAAVFSSGRPALVVPRVIPARILSHVAVAWNGSLEAARTIGQSISLLHEADRVTIIEVATSHATETRSADLSGYLRYHGIVADIRTIERPLPASVGECILSTAKDIDASILVMGAYTHSRVREFFLGGVTRHMLDRAAIPLLMAH